MNLLNSLTIKNLKLNKKRTFVTIIGIMLSVALLTAVATIYSSCIKSLINFETYQKGNFHVAFFDVPINEVETIKNNRGVDDVYLTKNIGYASLKESKNEYKPYVYVKGFSNLIKNCIEHSKDNSNILLEVDENNVYTQVVIRDNGTGIDKEDLPHIFERFYKGKNSSCESCGIGLSLAKAIIEKSNGNIYVESKIGKGSTFTIKYFRM